MLVLRDTSNRGRLFGREGRLCVSHVNNVNIPPFGPSAVTSVLEDDTAVHLDGMDSQQPNTCLNRLLFFVLIISGEQSSPNIQEMHFTNEFIL